jgi:hypothetical protein
MNAQYEIVSSYDLQDVMEVVTLAMQNGWQPQGGIAVDGNGKILQAIVFRPKREELQRTAGPTISVG